ncbi:hypothetical protein HBH70_224780 [Parastagonospora nodorum]|nr:hypothetical protein HBH51_224240 [Parastagonospora nodorum]KAH3996212.1 hypothetical protein HBI10_162320 [Parastagonospora nodorum]KAH4019584.1 hypothetical protein HBI13_126680 [Parastagonospora nodorum]KAH4019656.1 hypothetical protein HBI09_184020 [Parastagonospora nodorum]KAH4043943.1 hypothetical protein HBH49_223310 [Parastagonospora nodorum]
MSAQSLFPYKHIVLRPHLIPAINLFFPRNQRNRNRPDPVPISASSKGLSEELYGCGLAFLQKAAFLSAPASLLGMTCFFSPKTWMQKSDDPPGQTKT